MSEALAQLLSADADGFFDAAWAQLRRNPAFTAEGFFKQERGLPKQTPCARFNGLAGLPQQAEGMAQ